MFATYPGIQVRPGGATSLHGDPHQLTDTLGVDGGKRIALEDALLRANVRCFRGTFGAVLSFSRIKWRGVRAI